MSGSPSPQPPATAPRNVSASVLRTVSVAVPGANERVLLVVMSDSQYQALLAEISATDAMPEAPAASASRPAPLVQGELELMLDEPVVYIGHGSQRASTALPPTEHRLLAYLLSNAEHVCTREQIVRAVWPNGHTDTRTVDQYVRRLRRSLKPLLADSMVQTVNRAGYRLVPQRDAASTEAARDQGFVTADSHRLPTVAAIGAGQSGCAPTHTPPNV